MASITRRVIKNARRRGVIIYSRQQCGVISPVYQWRRIFRRHKLLPGKPSDTMWDHITVTRRSNIKNDMRTLHSIGMERFGTGISYNVGIDHMTGEMGLGQSFDAAGAHTLNDKKIPNYTFNQNYVSLAMAWIGMPGATPTAQAVTAAAKFLAACMEEGALTKAFDFNPHNMVAFKTCPDTFEKSMGMIYHKAHHYLETETGRSTRQRKRFRKN